jgi:hypothetical protein
VNWPQRIDALVRKHQPDDPPAMNDAIQRAADRWPNLQVIDLNNKFNERNDWLQDDQLHPR